jgi:type I restriction-modification system DNA methylase subunit/predicted type IV restriction endonuclease
MNPPQTVLDLVEHFRRNADDLRSNRYNETELRREFLDPFFEALGWDVNNHLRYSETYKDVVHEPTRETEQGVPDYCFRVGGTSKFFLEAKKPSVRLKDNPDPALQLRRYAWSSKLPLSILSNFDELAIYDCRIAPKQGDKASVGRISYYTFDEYPQKWDEIASRFSKEAVLQGSFDRFAISSKAKRGTTEVDAAFLADIEIWRHDLAATIAVRNPNLSQRQVNFAVQRTIDRIIFLRICEDRGLESYGQLRALTEQSGIYLRLCNLFQLADKRYNSGLFHFHKEKDRDEDPDTLTPTITVEDARLKPILKKLYYPDSPYAFSHVPSDILGQVYEQFLGKVIRITPARQIKVELKPEVKKAGGVYYTPTYIVDYIVKSTVGKLLEGKSPKQIATVRVLDPACGSGSFLIGAYQYLLDWYRDRYLEDGPQKHKTEIVPDTVGNWRLTLGEKKKILTRHIFGVDIDSQAVEVTKLSLLLKVLETETQLKLFHERALPDLGRNIRCGNSLIGPDFYQNQQMRLLDDEDRYRVNVFDWKQGFPEAMKSGGFDAVIGNPPYGYMIAQPEQDYFSTTYAHQDYQKDLYLLFLERCNTGLVAKCGFFGMIFPNPWLTNLLQRNIRKFIVLNAEIKEIVHFRFPVFAKVTVDTEIVVLQNNLPNKTSEATVRIAESLEIFKNPKAEIKTIRHSQHKWQQLDGSVINIFSNLKEEALARKCVRLASPLRTLYFTNVGIKPYQVGKGNPPQTRHIVDNRPFDANRKVDSYFRPCLRGSDISRYLIAPLEDRFLKYGKWLAEPRPAANFDAPMKILMRQTGDSLIAALDCNQFICLNNMHVLVPREDHPDIRYVLGIINSSLMNWYYHSLNPEMGEAFAEVKKTNVDKLPILVPDPSSREQIDLHNRIKQLVKEMSEKVSKARSARTDQERTVFTRQIEATDRQIDKLVYELYGLTKDEIAIVESSVEG